LFQFFVVSDIVISLKIYLFSKITFNINDTLFNFSSLTYLLLTIGQ